MIKKMSFWFKIKFLINWLRQHKNTATIVTCAKCNGTRITLKEDKQAENVYISKYICEDCDSTAECVETWHIS